MGDRPSGLVLRRIAIGTASENLKRYSGQTQDDETALAINDAFWEIARRFAESHLNPRLQHRVSVSEVVNSAMKSALSDVGHERLTELNSDSFKSHLLTLVKHKLVSRIRHAQAEKRSVENEAALGSQLLADDKSLTPVAKTTVDEIATFAATELLKAAGESMPMRAYVLALGVLYHCPPNAIQEALRSSFPNEDVPALRTIQLQIQMGQQTLQTKLREIGGEADV